MNRILAAALAAICVLPASAGAIDLYESEDDDIRFSFEGYAQPYFRWVDDPCVWQSNDEGNFECERSETPDGFGLTRARVGFSGDYGRLGSFKLELRTVPNVEVLTARLRFEPTDWLTITAGRFKVPFSHQELTSESRLQLIDRAALISGTPGRQLGVSAAVETGFGTLDDDFLRIEAGVFNGESAKERAPVNNIDEDFLFAARMELAPFGRPTAGEGDLRAPTYRDRPSLTVGGSWSYVTDGQNNFDQRNVGGDLSFAYQGASFYGEVFRRDRDYVDDESNADRHGFGWNLQAGFFIPAPYVRERLELAVRVEQWDPEIAREADRAQDLLPTSAGTGPVNSSGTTARRNVVGGINWYFAGHDLKLQANYTHRTELEDWAGSDANPTDDEDGDVRDGVPRQVDDDTFVLQLTYRF